MIVGKGERPPRRWPAGSSAPTIASWSDSDMPLEADACDHACRVVAMIAEITTGPVRVYVQEARIRVWTYLPEQKGQDRHHHSRTCMRKRRMGASTPIYCGRDGARVFCSSGVDPNCHRSSASLRGVMRATKLCLATIAPLATIAVRRNGSGSATDKGR